MYSSKTIFLSNILMHEKRREVKREREREKKIEFYLPKAPFRSAVKLRVEESKKKGKKRREEKKASKLVG